MWSRAVVIAAVVLALAAVVGVAAQVETVFAELTDGDRGELQLSDREMNSIVHHLFADIMREGYADTDTNILDRDNNNHINNEDKKHDHYQDEEHVQAGAEAEAEDEHTSTEEEKNTNTASASSDMMRFTSSSSSSNSNAAITQKARGFFGKLKNMAKAAMKIASSVGNAMPSGIADTIARGLGKGLSSRIGSKLIGKVAQKAGRWLGKQFGLKDWSGVRADVPRPPLEHEAGDVEDCVGCRYVWLQVEMDVGSSAIEDNIYDAFHANALEAQKTPIFYPACQTMFDAIDDMLGDYMDGYTVDQICENSMLCR